MCGDLGDINLETWSQNYEEGKLYKKCSSGSSFFLRQKMIGDYISVFQARNMHKPWTRIKKRNPIRIDFAYLENMATNTMNVFHVRQLHLSALSRRKISFPLTLLKRNPPCTNSCKLLHN